MNQRSKDKNDLQKILHSQSYTQLTLSWAIVKGGNLLLGLSRFNPCWSSSSAPADWIFNHNFDVSWGNLEGQSCQTSLMLRYNWNQLQCHSSRLFGLPCCKSDAPALHSTGKWSCLSEAARQCSGQPGLIFLGPEAVNGGLITSSNTWMRHASRTAPLTSGRSAAGPGSAPVFKIFTSHGWFWDQLGPGWGGWPRLGSQRLLDF